VLITKSERTVTAKSKAPKTRLVAAGKKGIAVKLTPTIQANAEKDIDRLKGGRKNREE